MHIVNIMFARTAGGVEQAFVDYCEGLKGRGHRVTAFAHPGAAVLPQLAYLNIETVLLPNFSEWDPFATRRLRHYLEALRPDVVIAHSNRAYALSCRAIRGKYPLVGVAQNYSTRRLKGAEAAFTTTADLVAHLAVQGIPRDRIFHIPNMVECHALPQRGKRNDPPVVGTVGRFVHKKGFHIYIQALKILLDQGCRFRALLGGDGEEGESLKSQARDIGLDAVTLSFPGWVQDKKAFYSGIDIFCLPSLHEPFGIVLLEAFANGVPVVSTDSEGPRDIITPNYDALIVKKDDARSLAEGIKKLLDEPMVANDLAANAFAKVKTRYSIEKVSERIEDALVQIIDRWSETRKT